MMPLNNASAAFEQRYTSPGPCPPDPPTQDQPVARHRHSRTGPCPFWRHPHLELPRVLLHPVQPGLRLSEGLFLRVADIDAQRARVQIRDSKGNRDRFMPLPTATLDALRRFWEEHRNPELLFPNRHGGLKAAALATTPLDRGGVQRALRQVALACGIKKNQPAFLTPQLRNPPDRGRCQPARRSAHPVSVIT